MENSNEIAKRILSQYVQLPVKLDQKDATRSQHCAAPNLDRRIEHLIQRSDFKPNEQRRDKLSNSHRIQSIVSHPCCARRCLSANFSYDQVQQHLRLWGSLDQKTLLAELQAIMSASVTDPTTEDSFTLQGEHYLVRWNGVPLCRVAFQLLYGVSRRKLISAAQQSSHQHGNSLVLHENQLIAGILEFLDTLKKNCGSVFEDSERILLNGFHEKKHVWQAYVDTTPDTFGIASDSHFYAVWIHERPLYVVETDALKCATCSALDLELHSSSSSSKVQEVEGQKMFHLGRAKAHLTKLTKYLRQSKAGKINLIIGDHMRSKPLPKLHRSNLNLLMSQLLNVHFSGWYNGATSQSQYYLFPEHWSESGNSIISCLHQLLKELNLPKEKKLVLVFDNHSTQHNNAVLAYCDWLVRHAQRFITIKVLFLIAGHTKNAQDQLNSYVAHKYSKGEFFSIDQMCHGLADTRRKFSCQCRVMDWSSKFEPINRYPQIFKAHVFEFTHLGMRTKEFADDPEWNMWNNLDSNAHHLMLKEPPTGVIQPMKPYALSETKKKDIKKSLCYVPAKDHHYLRAILDNGVGFNLEAVDLLNDFKTSPPLPSLPTNVPIIFRTKAKHVQTVPVRQNSKTTHPEASISRSEIKDLLATQQNDEQPQ